MKKYLFFLCAAAILMGCYPEDERFKPEKLEIKNLGEWDNSGVPKYLCERGSAIENSLTTNFFSTLVSREDAIEKYPQWFADSTETDNNLMLLQDTDMTITFLSEEANNDNTTGYYVYPTNNPPAYPNAIDNYVVLFPNTTMNGQEVLMQGDKICVPGLSAGTTLGFFVVIQGWRNNQVSIGQGQNFVFTNHEFNKAEAEAGETLKKSLLFYDEETKKYVVTFEALYGPNSDNDYDDAAIVLEFSNPNAVNPAGITRLPSGN